jgi:hypothetical protein
MELSMDRFFSLRPFALFLITLGVLAASATARAAERPYAARGTAQFTSGTDFEGAGTATHLGLYEEEGVAVFSPTRDPVVLQVDAEVIYTAANGDELHAVISGTLNGLTGVVTATVTYVGGTGRFADASGSGALSGQLYPDGSIDVVVEGTIDY